MPTSQTVIYKAEPDKVWGAVVKLVTTAGYAVVKTDQAARQIVYQVPAKGINWAQNVMISVTGVEADETLVTVLAESVQFSYAEGSKQRELVGFIVTELDKKFPKAPVQPAMNAPGTSSGCLVALLIITGSVLCACLAS
jgi:hypothetical protein